MGRVPAQIKGFKDARFKSYTSLEAATEAYRGDPAEQMALFRAMAHHKPLHVNYDAFPEIRRDAIAVDAACSRNPGPVEYQGVMVGTGERIFRIGPLEDSTNNIGEYLAIIRGGTATPPRQPRDPDILRLQDGTVMDTQQGTPVKNDTYTTQRKDNGNAAAGRCMAARAQAHTEPHPQMGHRPMGRSRPTLAVNDHKQCRRS